MSKAEIKRIITLLDRAVNQDTYDKLKEDSRKENPDGRVCYPYVAGGCKSVITRNNELINKAIKQLIELL